MRYGTLQRWLTDLFASILLLKIFERHNSVEREEIMPDYYGHILDPNHVQNNQQTARSDSETDSVETGDASSRTDLDWSKLSHDRERSLNHRVKAKSSILCLIVDDDCLIAGLEGGDIVVRTTWPRDSPASSDSPSSRLGRWTLSSRSLPSMLIRRAY